MSNIHVNQFLLFETGTYDPQYRRSLVTSTQADKLARLQEATQFGTLLTPTALAPIASEIIMPNTRVEPGGVFIPGGWNNKRYHFIMEIIANSVGGTGGRYRKIISGYTNGADLSYGGLLPPDMQLYINGHLTMRDIKVPGPHGVQYQSTIIGNDQILLGHYDNPHSSRNDFTLRPYDVLLRLGSNKMLSEEDDHMGGTVNFNLAGTFAQGIKNSSRKNSAPGTYMSKLLTACKDSRDSSDNMFLDEQAATMDVAAGALSENLLSNDLTFSMFNKLTDFANTGFITLGQLERMCPGVESNAKVHKRSAISNLRPSQSAGVSASMVEETPEAIIATQLTNALPGILLDNALNKVSLVITNMNVDGSCTVMPMEHTLGSVISGIDLIQMFEKVRYRIITQLMPGITQNNVIGVYIIVECDTLADTFVKVSIEGKPYEEFISPTFADSLFSPIITGSQSILDRVATDIENLSVNIGITSNMLQPAPRTYSSAPHHAPTTGASKIRFR